jgi:hypothetical protein
VSINPTLDSKKRWLVPTILMLFAVALVGWLTTIGVNSHNHGQANDLSAIAGHNIQEIQPATYEGPNRPADPILRIPTTGTIRGRVTSEEWAMWPSEVVIELLNRKNNELIRSYACRRGENKFVFDNLDFGKYRLRLVGDRILPFAIDASISASNPHLIQNLSLKNSASVTGYVHDTAGNPAADVQIVAQFQHKIEGYYSPPLITNTNESGYFEIQGLRPGQHQVYVGAEKSPLSKVEKINISENAPQAYLQFTINQFGTASIKVKIINTNSGVDHASEYKKVRVSAERLGSEPKFLLSVELNQDGVAHFNALPPGRYAFTAYGGGYRRTIQSASIVTSQNTGTTIQLRKR